MTGNLQNVRALIDAKIAAHGERLRLRRERTALVGGGASADAAPRMCAKNSCFDVTLCRQGLPAGLKVPSTEPRPPDLHAANLSFAARVVIAVRDRFDGDAPRVYKAARLTCAAYSQIASDETHAVSKRTAIRFAFALRLTPDEARLLLKSAGFAFSNAKAEDFVLQACLEANPPIYDFETVNALLREYCVDYQY